MPKRKSKEPVSPPQQDHTDADVGAVETDLLPAQDNGHSSEPELTPIPEQTEEPAQVQLTIKGSDRSARAAAKRFGGEAPRAPAVATPADDPEPPEDNTDELLADGRNMVVVRRQYPKSVQMSDGSKRRCAVRLPDSYQCPTTREEIENDVFERFGGKKYKCTIHPATTNGEQTQLGFFTIEHPDEIEPFFEDAPTASQQDPRDVRHDLSTSSEDPTMRETDQLAEYQKKIERRLDRATKLKEIREMEKMAAKAERELEEIEKPTALAVPTGESDELRKLREKNAALEAALAEKKVNDRFDKVETALASIATAVAAPTKSAGEDPTMKFMIEKMKSDDTRFTEMMKALTAKQTTPAPVGNDITTLLDQFTKLKALTGAGENKGGRLSDLESRIIDLGFEKLQGGGGDDSGGSDEEDDVARLAVKEFAPILKSIVEKKMGQDGAGQISPEREKQIYEESAKIAVNKIAETLHAQGIELKVDTNGNLIALAGGKPAGTGKPVVPPRQHAGTKVVGESRTSSGVVKRVSIEPTDLSKKTVQPTVQSEPPAETTQEGGKVSYGVFPLLGDGGTTLKIEFPVHPGEDRYERKRAIDFILAGIRSEIRQQFPQKAEAKQSIESFVAHDAIEYLDDELLNKLLDIGSGPELEKLLTDSGGDKVQIEEIKKAGEDEVVAKFLRRLIKTIQEAWEDEKRKK